MNANEDALQNILNQISSFNTEQSAIDEQEATLNAQIASIRLEIFKLRDKRTEVKRKRIAAEKDKESVERKLQLEREAAIIEQDLEAKRAEAEALIADAPWRSIAKDFQIDGALNLPERGLLGDRRGLGKTLTSLIWRRTQGAKRLLVCLRREVSHDFIKEIGIREPGLFVYPLVSVNPEQRKFAAMLLNGHAEYVVVTNIESWRRNIDKTIDDLLKIEFDAVILDEAHHIKNSATGTAQGFFKVAERIPKVLEMTGTPIKNKPQEMYSLLHALYPDLFPRENKFLIDYCIQSAPNKWKFKESGLKALVETIKPFYVARTPEDVGRDVPPPRIIDYELDMEAHPKQKQAYKTMTEHSLAMLESGKALPIVSQLALMTRQAQVVSWPAGIVFEVKDPFDPEIVIETVRFDVHESVKADWAEDFIKELIDEGQRIVLFSRFKPAIYELEKRLTAAGHSVAVITGDTKGNRGEIFDDFDLKTAPANPKYDILLATYQTVGESANFNAARHMILYDRFWNPGNEDQAIGRIDRLNSTDQATIHVPHVVGTIDMFMEELIDTKRNLVSDFKDANDAQARLINHLKETM